MPTMAAKLKETTKSTKTLEVATVEDIESPKVVTIPIIKKGSKGRRKLQAPELTPQVETEILLLNDTATMDLTNSVEPINTVKSILDVVETPTQDITNEITTSFNIDEFKVLMNSTLAKSTCSAEMRKGMIVALETVLYTAGRYNGIRHLTMHEIPVGHRPGVNIDPTTGHVLENYTARDVGTDKTRVEYL